MNKTISLFLLSFCLLIYGTVYANAKDKPSPYEKIYLEIGYKTVDEALSDFEQHFNRKLKLPLRIPTISFTHYFGRLSDVDGDLNDSFEMKLISDQSPQNHYKIDVRPIKYKIPIQDEYILNTFELSNESEATYMTNSGFNVLVFEKDDWQYMLSIDKRASDKITPETLVEIANSIDY